MPSPGRITVTILALLSARIQQAIDVAAMRGKKVAMLGSSPENNVRVATGLGT